jgi:formylglycine-generating enzyme required for sulfatase activity/pectate lyase
LNATPGAVQLGTDKDRSGVLVTLTSFFITGNDDDLKIAHGPAQLGRCGLEVGLGGRVIAVTSLDAEGPGTLDAALRAKGPWIVVFRVGGTIELEKHLSITEPFVTVAGQTAPGDGICLRGAGIRINTHDVVLRHLRVRPGDHPVGPKPDNRDAISIGSSRQGVYNVVVDHCSASWTMDETVQVWYDARDITFQWCVISEALNDSLHQEGAHGYGVIIGSRSGKRVTMHHCLLAHHDRRHPRIAPKHGDIRSILDFRNNVIYNHGRSTFGIIKGKTCVNYIGNTIQPGLNSGERPEDRLDMSGEAIYLEDNVLTWRRSGLTKPAAEMIASDPFAAPMVTTQPAGDAYEHVLRFAGATLPVRDVVDHRVVNETRNGTGELIDSQWDVGGWPAYANAVAPGDKDGDGMPDRWEEAHGFDPNDASDGCQDADGDVYTNVEEYLNGTDPHSSHHDAGTLHTDVRVQSGNEALRGAAARSLGEEIKECWKRTAVDPETRDASLSKAGASGKEVGDYLGVDFVPVEAGTFLMDRDDEWTWGPIEETLSGYEIAVCEVTQEQWREVMGAVPWTGRLYAKDAPACPASYVSWEDCQAFVERLNATGGPWRYALPTNAQWERAARAGTGRLLGVRKGRKGIEPSGRQRLAERTWSRENTVAVGAPHPQPVGSREANPWGLHDMAGNVLEWCHDKCDSKGGRWYWRDLKEVVDPTGLSRSDYRSCRGKSFYRPLDAMLSYSMCAHKVDYRSFETGFRLVRTRR